jgi:hypothetical protein
MLRSQTIVVATHDIDDCSALIGGYGPDSVPTGALSSRSAPERLWQQSMRQMELMENCLIKQMLAIKVRSRMSVICATPVQKREGGPC